MSLILRLPIQETQIRLPPNRNHAGENTPILLRHECKTKRCDRGPEFTAIHERHWDSAFDVLEYLIEIVAGKQGLHAEEIAVEDGREQDLVDGYFGDEGEQLRGIVEVNGEKSEPKI
jgi:hypothetical protein